MEKVTNVKTVPKSRVPTLFHEVDENGKVRRAKSFWQDFEQLFQSIKLNH